MSDSSLEIQQLRRKLEAREEELQRKIQGQQPATLDEYLRYCHQHLFKSLQVQDTSKSSAWGPTGVTDKYYPLRLRSWEGFITTQQRHYDIIKDILHDEHLFPSLSDVLAMKRVSSKRPVASEKDIRKFMLLALEDPVENIFDSIESRSNAHPMSREFDCAAVSFENQPYSLTESDAEEEDEGDDEMFGEDVQMGQGQSGPNQRVARDRKISRREGPDKWCFWTNHNGATKIAFPIEYKAAHKVPVEGLRQALGKEDLFAQVISTTFSGMVSADKDIRSQERTEEMVAKALAQTFHYMIHLGTAYGILAAGKSMVFLWVRDDDPKALYYHMVEPERDAEGGDGSEIAPFYTAVAQLAAFCLRASRSPKRPDGWREGAESVLKKWPQLYSEMDYAMTDEETSTESTRSTMSFVDPDAVDEPTTELRRSGRLSCKGAEMIRKDDSDSKDDDDDRVYRDRPMTSTATTREASNKRKHVSSGSDSPTSAEAASEAQHEARQYCTQRCLLGLKRRSALDDNCPNVSLHRSSSSGSHHPIDVTEFASLIRAQLGRCLDRHCEPLDVYGMFGARGALFKLTLVEYGYTFVGKGTYARATRHLRREAQVYSRLEWLQGEVVPVHLGNIDLERPYYLVAAKIVHMLLMSWAGGKVEAATAGVPDLAAEVMRSLRPVLAEGVVHDDLRKANMLWNAERRRVMIIDFDRATLLPPARHKQLLRLSEKKRKRKDANLENFVRNHVLRSS